MEEVQARTTHGDVGRLGESFHISLRSEHNSGRPAGARLDRTRTASVRAATLG